MRLTGGLLPLACGLVAVAAEPDFQALVPKLDVSDPLTCARAYSLEIDANMNGTDGFFPLGVLGEDFVHGMNVAIGGNYVCQGVSPKARPEGLSPQGVYGISLWAALSAQTRPELAKIRDQNGKEVRCACLFDPQVRAYVFDYARACVSNALAVADEKIFKWEIDNEYLPPLDYSEPAVAAFRTWLEAVCYKGDLAKLNRAWKKGYASFVEAEPCRLDDYARNPGHFMDWSRFQQETFAEFLADYYKVVWELDPKHRSVNGKDTQSSLEMQRIARTKRGNHELIGQAIRPYTNGVRGMDHYGHGDRNAYEMNFFTHTIVPDDWTPGTRRGMLYGESNNHNGPGWQFAQTVWRMIPNGLRGGTFFCNGWFGAWGDWASFGFIGPDGDNREKLFYLPRFYAAVHRTERLFTQSAPVMGVPTLAILMPVRDVPFGIDDNLEPWGFPINSRLRLYSHLRDAGYHVNVITYEKLGAAYMKNIDALFLVGTEHLTDADVANVRAYVAGGGCLFCDVRCGAFDEHHLPREGNDLSDVLGVTFQGIWESSDVVVDQGDVWFASPWGNLVRADGKVTWKATTAEVVNARHARNYSNKAAIWTRHAFGRGRAYWTNTQMGTIRSESAHDEVPARELFRALLADAGLTPSYTLASDETCNFRCEKPLVDAKGNVMIAVSSLTYRPRHAARLEGLARGGAAGLRRARAGRGGARHVCRHRAVGGRSGTLSEPHLSAGRGALRHGGAARRRDPHGRRARHSEDGARGPADGQLGERQHAVGRVDGRGLPPFVCRGHGKRRGDSRQSERHARRRHGDLGTAERRPGGSPQALPLEGHCRADGRVRPQVRPRADARTPLGDAHAQPPPCADARAAELLRGRHGVLGSGRASARVGNGDSGRVALCGGAP